MICRNCGTTNAESALFCQQCDKELFLANKSMDIVLGKETPSNKQQILKELILNLNHLSKRAEKENSGGGTRNSKHIYERSYRRASRHSGIN
jgi:hypothetical protein